MNMRNNENEVDLDEIKFGSNREVFELTLLTSDAENGYSYEDYENCRTELEERLEKSGFFQD